MPQAALVGLVKGGLAIGLSKGVATAVATFALKTAAFVGVSKIASSLQKRRAPAGTVAERQASTATLSLGESPREAVFGRCVTGGSLMDAGNYGGANGTDRECYVIALADHALDALEGFWAWGEFFPFTANGQQSGFDGGLDIEFQNATPTGSAPPARFSGLGWSALDVACGVTKVWVEFTAGLVEARGSRPEFEWQVRGKRCYDPRKDSTVGGSGAHRWANPATWEWTENPIVQQYNFDRGIFAGDAVTSPDMLWLGRGLTEVEAPPQDIFAAANLCDELVALKAGGTEARYRAGGVISGAMTFDQVAQMFADAVGGQVTQAGGGVRIDPGAAKTTVAEITDADRPGGEKTRFERYLAEPERFNTVVARYVEPAQKWRQHTAPVRRSMADVLADGRPKEDALELALVTSGTQAQRIAEQRRRLNRMERRAIIVLGPRFSFLEEGDWIGWTSDRYHGGGRVVYRVEKWTRGPERRRMLVLREINASAFTWTASTDEYTPGAAPPDAPGALNALDLDGVTVAGISKGGVPGVRVTWDTPVDPAVMAVRVEVRELGQAEVTPTATADVNAGVMDVTGGVPSGATIQVRVLPIGPQHRAIIPSAWATLTSAMLAAGTAVALVDADGNPVTPQDLLDLQAYAAFRNKGGWSDQSDIDAPSNVDLTTPGGSGVLRFTPDGSGTTTYLQWALNEAGAKVSRVRFKIRAASTALTRDDWDGRLTYSTAALGHSLTAGRMARASWPGSVTADRWRIVDFDCAGLDDYLASTILQVRGYLIEPTSPAIEIDWIEVGYTQGATANTGALADKDQADFATDVSGADKPVNKAGQLVTGAETTNTTPNQYRALLPAGGQRIERKTPSALGNSRGGSANAVVTTTVPSAGSGTAVVQVMDTPADGSFKRSESTGTSWRGWQRHFSEEQKPSFALEDLIDTGSTPATRAAYRTAFGYSAGFDGEGILARRDTVGSGQIDPNAVTVEKLAKVFGSDNLFADECWGASLNPADGVFRGNPGSARWEPVAVGSGPTDLQLTIPFGSEVDNNIFCPVTRVHEDNWYLTTCWAETSGSTQPGTNALFEIYIVWCKFNDVNNIVGFTEIVGPTLDNTARPYTWMGQPPAGATGAVFRLRRTGGYGRNVHFSGPRILMLGDSKTLPINVPQGSGASFANPNMLSSSSSSSISVEATTYRGIGSFTIDLPATTIGSLSAGTRYAVFRDLQAGVYRAVSSNATIYLSNPARHLYLGAQYTQNSGGGFPSPPSLPPGNADGGGGKGPSLP